MQPQALSSPGGEPPGVVVPHQHSQFLGANPIFLEKKLSANELEGFVNKENVVISHLWVGFA